jgi:formylglycine-generating enzyme required for sulfatase activity
VAGSAWHHPVVPERDADALASRQANAALALLRLGEAESVWPLLRHTPDPSRRSYIQARLAPFGADPELLIQRLLLEQDVSARRVLITALGEFNDTQLPVTARRKLVPQLLDWHRNDPDPGIHGAVDWLLRHSMEGPAKRPADWGQRDALEQMDRELQSTAPQGGRRWYVNSQGHTLAVVPGPVEFRMGSPTSEADRYEDELRHRNRIERTFAIATKEVTMAQFEVFMKANPGIAGRYRNRYTPEADGPVLAVSWYTAAQYCRWLSEQEKFHPSQMVYPSIDEIEKAKESRTPLRLSADHLTQTGYRLPTEAEWEYACRAGAETSRPFGHTAELLPRYAWFLHNSIGDRTRPVGQKRPNDLGLFDMLGNASEWCQDPAWSYQPDLPGNPVDDREDRAGLTDGVKYMFRGGSFIIHPPEVRCAFRGYLAPSIGLASVGMRVARTIRP